MRLRRTRVDYLTGKGLNVPLVSVPGLMSFA